MSKWLILLLVILFLFLGTFFALNYFFANNLSFQSLPFIGATPTPVAASTLSMSPNSVNAVPGTPTVINVLLQTKNISPSLVQLELAYDPAFIANIQISPGTFFANPT